MMDTMTLTDFLLARITEVERRFEYGCDGDGEYSDVADLVDIVLAEYDAKRRIVDALRHIDAGVLIVGSTPAGQAEYRSGVLFAVRAFAAAHADHPDYRQEWKP